MDRTAEREGNGNTKISPEKDTEGRDLPPEQQDIRYSVDGGEAEQYTSLPERDDVALGDEDETYTENDKTVDFTWAVVPAESLIVSHDKYGDANPQYPAELQPRDRSRAASQEQVRQLRTFFNALYSVTGFAMTSLGAWQSVYSLGLSQCTRYRIFPDTVREPSSMRL